MCIQLFGGGRAVPRAVLRTGTTEGMDAASSSPAGTRMSMQCQCVMCMLHVQSNNAGRLYKDMHRCVHGHGYVPVPVHVHVRVHVLAHVLAHGIVQQRVCGAPARSTM